MAVGLLSLPTELLRRIFSMVSVEANLHTRVYDDNVPRRALLRSISTCRTLEPFARESAYDSIDLASLLSYERAFASTSRLLMDCRKPDSRTAASIRDLAIRLWPAPQTGEDVDDPRRHEDKVDLFHVSLGLLAKCRRLQQLDLIVAGLRVAFVQLVFDVLPVSLLRHLTFGASQYSPEANTFMSTGMLAQLLASAPHLQQLTFVRVDFIFEEVASCLLTVPANPDVAIDFRMCYLSNEPTAEQMGMTIKSCWTATHFTVTSAVADDNSESNAASLSELEYFNIMLKVAGHRLRKLHYSVRQPCDERYPLPQLDHCPQLDQLIMEGSFAFDADYWQWLPKTVSKLQLGPKTFCMEDIDPLCDMLALEKRPLRALKQLELGSSELIRFVPPALRGIAMLPGTRELEMETRLQKWISEVKIW